MIRKNPFVSGEIYHIFNRSIANFIIFNNEFEFIRMQQLFRYYLTDNEVKFSDFLGSKGVERIGFNDLVNTISKDKAKLVQIIAFCIMPTHIHIVLKQLLNDGISDYMQRVLNSYSTYFNIIHKRKGPLWESRFQSVLVENNDQLDHLVRYLHLNPATANLVEKPEDWEFSSYREYLGKIPQNATICQYDDILLIKPRSYQKFVNDQISYQRELGKIKKLLLD